MWRAALLGVTTGACLVQWHGCADSPFLRLIVSGVLMLPGSLSDEHRSRAVTREFQLEHACPSTALTTGPCPGYWRDHIVPLGRGGADAVENMQLAKTRGHGRARSEVDQDPGGSCKGPASSRPPSLSPISVVAAAVG
jgi:hypothetical protein